MGCSEMKSLMTDLQTNKPQKRIIRQQHRNFALIVRTECLHDSRNGKTEQRSEDHKAHSFNSTDQPEREAASRGLSEVEIYRMIYEINDDL